MALTERQISDQLYLANAFRRGQGTARILFLIPESLWRPLKASWWRGKEASVIGGDEDSNYLLRHCDGSVRLWDHRAGRDEVLAPNVPAFLASLTREAP